MNLKRIYFFVACLLVMTVLCSCEDLIEVDPPRSGLPRAEVFEDEVTATAAISRLYYPLSEEGFRWIAYPASLAGDELMTENGDATTAQFYTNEILSNNSSIASAWSTGYKSIYVANAAIQGLNKSEKLSADLKNQLLGEAKFFRAFNHFYLVNLFGAVPYVTGTDYRVNGLLKREPVEDVYVKIIADLVEARELLSADYAYFKNERVRVNKWAAITLLARVYLYRQDWGRAEEQASLVINNTALFELIAPEKVFLKNSREAIWQIIPPYPQEYTWEGNNLNKPYYNAGNTTITADLANAFEPGDKRKTEWIGFGDDSDHTWYYSRKYRETSLDTVGTDEYSMVLRFAELYLIRAEARAHQPGKLTGANSAQSDINEIRSRAGLPDLSAEVDTEAELLAAVEQERRVELFTEWGHRWLDLKRTGRAEAVLGPIKTNFTVTDLLYPIPFSELQLNPNMTQNDGY